MYYMWDVINGESSGSEVNALDSQSEDHWFESHRGLEFQGFRIHSFHSTLDRLGDCGKFPSDPLGGKGGSHVQGQ